MHVLAWHLAFYHYRFHWTVVTVIVCSNNRVACVHRLLRWGSSTVADLVEVWDARTQIPPDMHLEVEEVSLPMLSPSDLVSQGSFASNGFEVQRPAARTASR